MTCVFIKYMLQVVILEYCGGGELLPRLAKMPTHTEGDVCAVFVQLVQALIYLHTLDIIHR